MKLFSFFAGIFLLTVSADGGCNKKKSSEIYKGRLEIKALCMNYTIKVLEGNIDTSLISASWTDESTNKDYTNVFGLASKCTFPPEIKEGEEFYFVLDDSARRDCAVCLAYYPVPPKKLMIKVVEK